MRGFNPDELGLVASSHRSLSGFSSGFPPRSLAVYISRMTRISWAWLARIWRNLKRLFIDPHKGRIGLVTGYVGYRLVDFVRLWLSLRLQKYASRNQTLARSHGDCGNRPFIG